MTWQTWLFLPVAGIAFGISGFKLSQLIRMMKAHKGTATAKNRFARIPERVSTVLINVLGQKAVLEKKIPGIAHTMIFWGFIIITTGTIEQFASTIYLPLHFSNWMGAAYGPLVYVQDIFTSFVLFGVLYSFYRRLVLRPKHLGQSKDAFIILTLTGSLMISIFLMNAFHIVGENPWFASWMPISSAIASLFAGTPTETAEHLFTAFKWTHMFIVLGFGIYIPSSKHLHVLAAGPNTFFKRLDREKGMTTIDFTNESITQYGTAKVTDLSWKDALDYYSCTECGRCQEVCPAWNTEKPLSPKNLITGLKYNLFHNKEAVLAKNYDAVTTAIDSNVTEDIIWACTSCRACEIACPVFIEHTDKIFDIRRDLVMMQSKFPTEVQTVFKNLETNASPWAFAASDRANWADGLEIQKVSDLGTAKELDVLLWVGCAGSFDDRNKKVIRAFVNVLKKAEIKFAILGTEEQCTGDSARRIGNEYLFQTLATANVETMNRYGVTRIVTACPHCFNTLKNEYGDFGGKYEVFHHSQYLAKLIGDGKIKPQKTINESVTYHDSCYMGRWNGVYSDPRAVVESVSKAPVLEMKSTGEKSMCCGAGGGRMWMEEHIGRRVNIVRTEQALETGAKVIAANCPFCMTMITDGVKSKEMTDTVKVMDIAEMIEQSL